MSAAGFRWVLNRQEFREVSAVATVETDRPGMPREPHGIRCVRFGGVVVDATANRVGVSVAMHEVDSIALRWGGVVVAVPFPAV